MPNDNIFSWELPGTFCYFPESRAFNNPEPYTQESPGSQTYWPVYKNICAKNTELSKVKPSVRKLYCTHDNAPLRQNVQYMVWSSLLRPTKLHRVMEDRPTSKILVTAVLALCFVVLHVSLREQQAEKTLDQNSSNRQNRKLLQYNTSMQRASSKPRHELHHARTEVRNKK